MIRFKINGNWVETPDDLNISLQFINQLFQFDKIQLSRTLEFNLPKTPTNNIIFQFSDLPEFTGGFMRSKHSAELYFSGGKIDGILVVNSFKNNSYKCVFIYGDLLKLKEIQDLGNIRNYTTFSDLIPPFPVQIKEPGNFSQNFAFYEYENGIPNHLNTELNMFPTVKIKYLLDKSSDALNINTEFSSETSENLINRVGIKLNKLHANGIVSNVRYDRDFFYTNSFFSVGDVIFPVSAIKHVNDVVGVIRYITPTTMQTFIAEFDMNVTINDTNTDIACLISDSATSDAWSSPGWGAPPYGDTPPHIISGTQFFLKAGQCLYFAKNSNYNKWYETVNDNLTIIISCERIDGVYTYPFSYRLYPNLPDLTFIDICKIISDLTDMGLIWNEKESKITFFDYNFNKENYIDLSNKIINISEIGRTFPEFSQRNRIVCEDNDSIINTFFKEYIVINSNIEEYKEIRKIPLSSSDQNDLGFALITDFVRQENGNLKNNSKKEVLVYAQQLPALQSQLGVIRDISPGSLEAPSETNYLRHILSTSTTIIATVFMYMFEFQQIAPTTVIKLQGRFYAIYSAKWSNNKATLTLISI